MAGTKGAVRLHAPFWSTATLTVSNDSEPPEYPVAWPQVTGAWLVVITAGVTAQMCWDGGYRTDGGMVAAVQMFPALSGARRSCHLSHPSVA